MKKLKLLKYKGLIYDILNHIIRFINKINEYSNNTVIRIEATSTNKFNIEIVDENKTYLINTHSEALNTCLDTAGVNAYYVGYGNASDTSNYHIVKIIEYSPSEFVICMLGHVD